MCNLIAETLFVMVKIERKMAIQGHVFWGQWKGDKGVVLNNTMLKIMGASFPKVLKTYAPESPKIQVFDYPTVV